MWFISKKKEVDVSKEQREEAEAVRMQRERASTDAARFRSLSTFR